MPILVQGMLTYLAGFVDNIMVGQIGTEAMSGVAIAKDMGETFMPMLASITAILSNTALNYLICQMAERVKLIAGFILLKKGVWLNNIVHEKAAGIPAAPRVDQSSANRP